MGTLLIRTTQDPTRRHRRQYRNSSLPQELTQRIDVPDLLGHAQEDDDDQGVSASILLRVHYNRSAFGKQGVPHLPEEVGFETFPTTGSQFRFAHIEDLSQQGRIRSSPGTRLG